jgi:signal peptidase I
VKRSTRIWLIAAVAALALVAANVVMYTRVVRPLATKVSESIPNAAFVMAESSMDPTLPPGTQALVNLSTNPKRGQIIVYALPGAPKEQLLVSRVIAVGGDRVEMRNGVIFLNGKQLDEPYVAHTELRRFLDENTVAPGAVWVAGDNRMNSFDSRHFGDVPLTDVRGVVVLRP